jgi:hypothetical protein
LDRNWCIILLKLPLAGGLGAFVFIFWPIPKCWSHSDMLFFCYWTNCPRSSVDWLCTWGGF